MTMLPLSTMLPVVVSPCEAGMRMGALLVREERTELPPETWKVPLPELLRVPLAMVALVRTTVPQVRR